VEKKENVIRWQPTKEKKDFARIVIKRKIDSDFKAFCHHCRRFFFNILFISGVLNAK